MTSDLDHNPGSWESGSLCGSLCQSVCDGNARRACSSLPGERRGPQQEVSHHSRTEHLLLSSCHITPSNLKQMHRFVPECFPECGVICISLSVSRLSVLHGRRVRDREAPAVCTDCVCASVWLQLRALWSNAAAESRFWFAQRKGCSHHLLGSWNSPSCQRIYGEEEVCVAMLILMHGERRRKTVVSIGRNPSLITRVGEDDGCCFPRLHCSG